MMFDLNQCMILGLYEYNREYNQRFSSNIWSYYSLLYFFLDLLFAFRYNLSFVFVR
jgi:hypothetical protein